MTPNDPNAFEFDLGKIPPELAVWAEMALRDRRHQQFHSLLRLLVFVVLWMLLLLVLAVHDLTRAVARRA